MWVCDENGDYFQIESQMAVDALGKGTSYGKGVKGKREILQQHALWQLLGARAFQKGLSKPTQMQEMQQGLVQNNPNARKQTGACPNRSLNTGNKHLPTSPALVFFPIKHFGMR